MNKQEIREYVEEKLCWLDENFHIQEFLIHEDFQNKYGTVYVHADELDKFNVSSKEIRSCFEQFICEVEGWLIFEYKRPFSTRKDILELIRSKYRTNDQNLNVFLAKK